jgi:hypothetical protein
MAKADEVAEGDIPYNNATDDLNASNAVDLLDGSNDDIEAQFEFILDSAVPSRARGAEPGGVDDGSCRMWIGRKRVDHDVALEAAGGAVLGREQDQGGDPALAADPPIGAAGLDGRCGGSGEQRLLVLFDARQAARRRLDILPRPA